MRKITLYLLLLLPVVTFGQTLRGKLIDKKKRVPVPYVTVVDQQAERGTYSDSSGYFSIQIVQQLPTTISFSSIGYRPISLEINTLMGERLVEMESDSILLNPITVLAKKINYGAYDLGYFQRLRMGYTVDYAPSNGTRIALYLKAEDPNLILSKLKFRFGPKKSDQAESFLVRARVLTDEEGKPGIDLITTNLTAQVMPRQDMLVLDVSRFNVTIPPNGFWLELDMLGYTDKEGKLNLINTTGLRLTESTAPYVGITTSGKSGESLKSKLGGHWHPYKQKDKYNTFMFGVEYLKEITR